MDGIQTAWIQAPISTSSNWRQEYLTSTVPPHPPGEMGATADSLPLGLQWGLKRNRASAYTCLALVLAAVTTMVKHPSRQQ